MEQKSLAFIIRGGVTRHCDPPMFVPVSDRHVHFASYFTKANNSHMHKQARLQGKFKRLVCYYFKDFKVVPAHSLLFLFCHFIVKVYGY